MNRICLQRLCRDHARPLSFKTAFSIPPSYDIEIVLYLSLALSNSPMKHCFRTLVLIAVLSVGAASPCIAADDTLVVGMKTVLNSLSPTHSSTRQTLVLCHNWADTLVYRDPVRKEIVPCLAESIRIREDGDLEFTLRPGVRFHNGERLTAEAVRFSMEIWKSADTISRKLFRSFTGISVIDERTVRITTSLNPSPALEILANLFFIYPPDLYRRVGAEAFGLHPVGTGPYRFVSWKSPEEIRFEANPDYFDSPKSAPGIPGLTIRIIPEEMLRIEALLKGELDLLRGGSVSPEQIHFLKQQEGITIKAADILRHYFLVMDARGRSGVDFFTDKRVRQAVNHAICRERIVKQILHGFAKVNLGAATAQHACHESNIRTYPHDPDRARKLLEEAGYPDGFSVDLYAARDESEAEAVAEDLRTVGIRTNVKWMGGQWDLLFEKLRAGRLPMALITWGSYSIFDASAILNPFFMLDDPFCQGSTPEIDRLLSEADCCTSSSKRKELLSEAQKLIAEEAFWVPLYTGNSVAAMRSDLDFSPAYDEVDRYFMARWKRNPLKNGNN